MLAAYVSVKPQTSLNWRFLNAETLCLLRFKFPFLSHQTLCWRSEAQKTPGQGQKIILNTDGDGLTSWRKTDAFSRHKKSWKCPLKYPEVWLTTTVYQTQCSASQSPETPNRRLQNCSNEGTQLHRLSRILNVQFGDFLLNVLATNSSRTIIHQLAPTEWNTAQQPGPQMLSEARQQQTALR